MIRAWSSHKTVASLVSLASLAAACRGVALATAIAVAPGDPAPALTGWTTSGARPFTADWSEPQLTLVNFWATWCMPCKTEMGHLQKLHERLEGRGLKIIGVYDSTEQQQVPAFLASAGVTYTVIGAGPRVDRDWGGIGTMPTSFLVNRKGTILRRYVGASPEQTDGLVADVEAALEGLQLPPQVMPRSVPTVPEIAAPSGR